MKRIYKYPINFHGVVTKVELPVTWKFIHFGLDGLGTYCMWAEVDENTNMFNYEFSIVGTGHEFPQDCMTLGTFVSPSALVWHLVMRGVST